MKVTAIMAIRNEDKYLRIALKHIVNSGIRLAILDNESTDNTSSILNEFKQHIDYYQKIPFNGHFDLTKILEAKSKVISQLDTDWLIHHDADEILESPIANESLKEGIERVALEGCTAINFNEFTFVPTKQQPDYENQDFYKTMLNYYFFEPYPFRLMRAWKNSPDVTQSGGGHSLSSDKQLIFPTQSFILRHYIVLSENHTYEKYAKRKFSKEDKAKGWHNQRLFFPSNISLPDEKEINKLTNYASKEFNCNTPLKKHFWQPKYEPLFRIVKNKILGRFIRFYK